LSPTRFVGRLAHSAALRLNASSELSVSPAETARKDDAPAAVQAAIVNVAELSAVSGAGGLIQTTSGDTSNALIVTTVAGVVGVPVRRRQCGDGRSPQHLRCDADGASRI
jgi:hypothetical protein